MGAFYRTVRAKRKGKKKGKIKRGKAIVIFFPSVFDTGQYFLMGREGEKKKRGGYLGKRSRGNGRFPSAEASQDR